MTRGLSPHGHVSNLLVTEEGDIVALLRARAGDAVLVGAPREPLRAIPVTRLRVLRDGGSVVAMTAEGTLDIPAAIAPREPANPSWCGRPLRAVDPDDHEIDLGAAAGPTIATKDPVASP